MKVFVDCESSGLDPWRNDPIHMAFIVTDDKLNIKDKFSVTSKPNHDENLWSKRAEDIHGISYRDAILYTNSASASDFIYERISSHGKYNTFICHALPMGSLESCFDYKMLFTWFWKNDKRERFYEIFGPIESTISKERKKTLELYGIESQKLDAWSRKLGIELDHHNCESDVAACLDIYKYKKSFMEELRGKERIKKEEIQKEEIKKDDKKRGLEVV